MQNPVTAKTWQEKHKALRPPAQNSQADTKPPVPVQINHPPQDSIIRPVDGQPVRMSNATKAI